jgi:flagellar biosynthesis/type III secretory pathway protein FliH
MSSSDPVRLPPWATPGEDPVAAWGPPAIEGSRAQPAPASRDPLTAAYTRGFEEGIAEGTARAEAELAPLAELLGGLARALERDQQRARAGAERNVAALAVVVARWLFQRDVEHDPAILADLIRRAVRLLPTANGIEIRGHPADIETLNGRIDFTEFDGRPWSVRWVADPTLDRGDFTLASPERLVDGRADVGLRSLYERLASD